MNRIYLRSVVEQRHLADELLKTEEAVLVHRSVPRALVLRCPDNCGDTLTVNLDPRSGKAWRLDRQEAGAFSLFPSVWRTQGCRAHFIIWRSGLYLVDHERLPIRWRSNFERRVLAALTEQLMTPLELADAIDEDPWLVSACLEDLSDQGLVKATESPLGDSKVYRRAT